MHPLILGLIVLGVLLLCVAGMAIGVMAGRQPLKHCGNAVTSADGQRMECAVCGQGQCKNPDKNQDKAAAAPSEA